MQYMAAGLVADFESTCLDAKSLDPRDARSWAERGNKKPARRARGPALSPAGQANLTSLGLQCRTSTAIASDVLPA